MSGGEKKKERENAMLTPEFLTKRKERQKAEDASTRPERKLASSRTVYPEEMSAKNKDTIKTFAKTDTRNLTIPEGNSKRGTGGRGWGGGEETSTQRGLIH